MTTTGKVLWTGKVRGRKETLYEAPTTHKREDAAFLRALCTFRAGSILWPSRIQVAGRLVDGSVLSIKETKGRKCVVTRHDFEGIDVFHFRPGKYDDHVSPALTAYTQRRIAELLAKVWGLNIHYKDVEKTNFGLSIPTPQGRVNIRVFTAKNYYYKKKDKIPIFIDRTDLQSYDYIAITWRQKEVVYTALTTPQKVLEAAISQFGPNVVAIAAPLRWLLAQTGAQVFDERVWTERFLYIWHLLQ